MINEIVGNGFLPNVYISKVLLEDKTIKDYYVKIKIALKDVKSPDYIWSNHPDFYNFIKIAVVFTSNSSLSDLLRTGQMSPTPSIIKKSKFFDNRTTIITKGIAEFTIDEGKFEKTFMSTVNKVCQIGTKNLDVYTCCYIDTSAAQDYFGVILAGQMKNYYGPVSSESVFKNGSLVSKSTIFKKPSGKIYFGPVHLHNEVYMEGAYHSDRPHSILEQIQVNNDKIVDNRSDKSVERTSSNFSVRGSMIGEMLYSLNNKTHLSAIIPLNIKQVAINKTKNGKILYNASPQLFNRFLSTVVVKSLKVKRKNIKLSRIITKSGTPKLIKSQTLSTAIVAFSSDDKSGSFRNNDELQQIYLNNNPDVRFFQFIDSKVSNKTRGTYKYSAEFTILDKSQKFLQDLLDGISLGLQNLKSEVSRLNLLKNYDYKKNELKTLVTINSNVLDSIDLYYDLVYYLKDIKDDKLAQLRSNKKSIFTKANYSAKLGSQFVLDYQSSFNNFMKKFEIKNKLSTTKRKTGTGGTIPGFLKIEKEFEDLINFKDFKNSYDYLGTQDNIGMTTFSLSQFEKRSDTEVNRLFKTDSSLENSDFDNLDPGVASGLKDISSSKMNFFAPLSVSLENQKIDLLNFENIDTAGLKQNFLKSTKEDKILTRTYNMFSRKPSRRRKKPRNKINVRKSINKTKSRAKNRFFVIPRSLPKKINNIEEVSAIIDSSEYLGEKSKFNQATDASEDASVFVTKNEIKETLDSSLNIKTNRNKKAFDLRTKDNAIAEALKGDRCTQEDCKKLPNHLKALYASRSDGVKNNILGADEANPNDSLEEKTLEANVDLLRNPETKIATEMIFQSIQEVEMMVGFKKDRNGFDLVNSPIFTRFDPSLINDNVSVLCRMRWAQNEQFGLAPSEQFRLPVLNKFFFISNSDLTDKKLSSLGLPTGTANNTQAQNQTKRMALAMTSNIVTQSVNNAALLLQPETSVNLAPTPSERVTIDNVAPEIESSTAVPATTRSTGVTGGSTGGGSY